MIPKLFTVDQTAQRLRSHTNPCTLHPSQVRKLASQMGVGRKYGGTWLFTVDDIKTLRKRRGPGRPPTKPKRKQK